MATYIWILMLFSQVWSYQIQKLRIDTKMFSVNNINNINEQYFVPKDDKFLDKLIENCDQTSFQKWSSSLDEAVVSDLCQFNATLAVNSSFKRLDGYWKLRYSSNKFNVGYRGSPQVIMFVNSTAKSVFLEISYPDNQKSLKKVLLQLIEPSSSSTSTTAEKNIWKHQLRSVELIRTLAIKLLSKIPFIRHSTFSTALAVPPISLVTKQILKRIFPGLCILSTYDLVYLDDDICIQRSCSINSKIENLSYNVFTRVYQTWDPSVGWVFVSAV